MQNYFEFFDIEPAFFPDETELRKKWRENSRAYHPDFAMGDEAAAKKAVEMSSLNNDAWKVLSQFDKRVAYILQLHDKPETGKSLPPDFLMEMMELNEALMEAGMGGDENEQKQLTTRVNEINSQLDADLEKAAKAWDQGEERTENMAAIEDCYLRKKYLLRLMENLNNFAPL
jgi:molecular chaperone HscB